MSNDLFNKDGVWGGNQKEYYDFAIDILDDACDGEHEQFVESMLSDILKAIPQDIEVLNEVAESVFLGEVSLGIGIDWLEAETGKKMSRMGLKKYVDKKYERLGKKS